MNQSKSPVLWIKDFFKWLRWTRTSYIMMSIFLAVILLTIIVWWPLVVDYFRTYNPSRPFWSQMDWLLIGIFLVMSALIMAGADLKRDAWIVIIGMAGGLVIEGWGTQTHIWTYFTNERPPLWIIPAWPIASLSIDRIVRGLNQLVPKISDRHMSWIYWFVFLGFYATMWLFVWPTLNKSLTQLALLSCGLLIIAAKEKRYAVLTFLAGSGLGYFLEVWGTTRECWTYYTLQTPPFFAVLAHGLAAVAFWRVGFLIRQILLTHFRLFNLPEKAG